MHARGDIGGDNISLQKMALKRVLKRGFFLLRRKVRRFMETGNTSVKRLFFRPFSRKLVSCWSNSEATLLNVSSANLGRERKERMKKSSDTSQTADKVQWNKHVLLRRLFSRKVVSSYKKEANEEATSTQHWTWWLNASSNGKVRTIIWNYVLVCLSEKREFTVVQREEEGEEWKRTLFSLFAEGFKQTTIGMNDKHHHQITELNAFE
jgi:hypothetical protein